MKHLVIDTNIFRKNPRLDSPEFKSLAYIAKISCIQLHIPYVIQREFSSYLEHEQRKKILSATKSISGAVNYDGSGEKTSELIKQLEELKASTDELVSERSKSFTDWIEINHVEVIPLSLDQASEALEAYFDGSLPFKEPKVRKDIPDSFIYQSIINLHDQFKDDLLVIIKDGSLREACVSRGIFAYESLTELLEIEEIQECLRQKLVDVNRPLILEHVYKFAEKEKDKIISKIEELLLTDEYRMISGKNIPGESGEIYISMVNEPHLIEIEEVEYIGAGLFIAYFSARTEVTYEYPVFYPDSLDLDPKKFYISALNEHYVEVETTDDIQFTGRIELDFDESIMKIINIDNLISALKDPKISISELEDFEINN